MSKVLDLVLAGTTPQFDDDESLSTTEFVQRAIGNDNGYAGLVANTTLTAAAHSGKFIYCSTATSITITLPAIATAPGGCKFPIFNTGVGDVVVNFNGAEKLVVNNTSDAVSSLTLKAGESICIESLGGGTLWYHSGGSAQLKWSRNLSGSIGASGWQRLPSGLLIQYGQVNTSASADVAFTFPVPFAVGPYAVMVSPYGLGAGVVGNWNVVTINDVKIAAFNMAGARVVAPVQVLALGT